MKLDRVFRRVRFKHRRAVGVGWATKSGGVESHVACSAQSQSYMRAVAERMDCIRPGRKHRIHAGNLAHSQMNE